MSAQDPRLPLLSVQLFYRLDHVIPALQGWCTLPRAMETAAAVIALRPKTIVVIGVWGGRDTIAAALACKECQQGRVVAIDPWQAAASVEGQITEDDRRWWSSQDMHEAVYRGFLRALNENGLGPDLVDVKRAKSDDVEPPTDIGILISDGNHGVQSIRDIERFAPNVVVGGLAYLDDLQWSGGAVLQSVEKLKSLGFVELYARDSGMWFQRVTK